MLHSKVLFCLIYRFTWTNIEIKTCQFFCILYFLINEKYHIKTLHGKNCYHIKLAHTSEVFGVTGNIKVYWSFTASNSFLCQHLGSFIYVFLEPPKLSNTRFCISSKTDNLKCLITEKPKEKIYFRYFCVYS